MFRLCSGAFIFDAGVSGATFLQTLRVRGALLRQGLEGLAHRYGLGEVRGMGLLLAMETADLSAPLIVQRVLNKGLLLNAPHEHLLRFMPALNVQIAEIEQMLESLETVVREL